MSIFTPGGRSTRQTSEIPVGDTGLLGLLGDDGLGRQEQVIRTAPPSAAIAVNRREFLSAVLRITDLVFPGFP
ncbi:hypothetical protein [Streptosporangium saharense]|uniref:hypothetical protein n=1 Tax=Streptosporangium saharense TaxID=1706840 RepID=UPI00369989DD